MAQSLEGRVISLLKGSAVGDQVNDHIGRSFAEAQYTMPLILVREQNVVEDQASPHSRRTLVIESYHSDPDQLDMIAEMTRSLLHRSTIGDPVFNILLSWDEEIFHEDISVHVRRQVYDFYSRAAE